MNALGAREDQPNRKRVFSLLYLYLLANLTLLGSEHHRICTAAEKHLNPTGVVNPGVKIRIMMPEGAVTFL